ncbi:MAG: hypothetical protein P8107_14570, partial [Spirochaetia bacterium]
MSVTPLLKARIACSWSPAGENDDTTWKRIVLLLKGILNYLSGLGNQLYRKDHEPAVPVDLHGDNLPGL